jgi:hypothetical protein
MKMRKVLSPPMPKDQLDKLISVVIQEDGKEQSLERVLNDDGTLDLFTE